MTTAPGNCVPPFGGGSVTSVTPVKGDGKTVVSVTLYTMYVAAMPRASAPGRLTWLGLLDVTFPHADNESDATIVEE